MLKDAIKLFDNYLYCLQSIDWKLFEKSKYNEQEIRRYFKQRAALSKEITALRNQFMIYLFNACSRTAMWFSFFFWIAIITIRKRKQKWTDDSRERPSKQCRTWSLNEYQFNFHDPYANDGKTHFQSEKKIFPKWTTDKVYNWIKTSIHECPKNNRCTRIENVQRNNKNYHNAAKTKLRRRNVLLNYHFH